MARCVAGADWEAGVFGTANDGMVPLISNDVAMPDDARVFPPQPDEGGGALRGIGMQIEPENHADDATHGVLGAFRIQTGKFSLPSRSKRDFKLSDHHELMEMGRLCFAN